MGKYGGHSGRAWDHGNSLFSTPSILLDESGGLVGVKGNPLQVQNNPGGVQTIGGIGVPIYITKVRPNDANAYVLYDGISDTTVAGTATNWVIPNIARTPGGTGTIVGAALMTDQATNVASYRLYLYARNIVPILDNAECTYLFTSNPSYVGKIDFPALVRESTNATAAKMDLVGGMLNYWTAPGDVNLYGQLQITLAAGFTPAALQKYALMLLVAQD